MGKFIDRVGEIHQNNKGESFTIIGYRDNKNVDIQFEDGTIVTKRAFSDLKVGKVRNPNSRSFYNVGFVGEGEYVTSIDRKRTKSYTHWKGMLYRCYSDKMVSYKDVTVCEEWHNFQNFAAWFEENWKPWMDSSWHLDKDVLFKGNKVYSPETCCLIPAELNNLVITNKYKRGELPIGVTKYHNKFKASSNTSGYISNLSTPEEAFKEYKAVKEAYIKKLVKKWREKVTEQVYNTLINYEVLITD